MSAPRTEAGRATSARMAVHDVWSVAGADREVAAIEAEPVAAERARLVAGVEGLPGTDVTGRARETGVGSLVSRAAVLALIRDTEGGEPMPLNEYGRAACVCGVSVLPENWSNHLLRQDGQHAAALREVEKA